MFEQGKAIFGKEFEVFMMRNESARGSGRDNGAKEEYYY